MKTKRKRIAFSPDNTAARNYRGTAESRVGRNTESVQRWRDDDGITRHAKYRRGGRRRNKFCRDKWTTVGPGFKTVCLNATGSVIIWIVNCPYYTDCETATWKLLLRAPSPFLFRMAKCNKQTRLQSRRSTEGGREKEISKCKEFFFFSFVFSLFRKI